MREPATTLLETAQFEYIMACIGERELQDQFDSGVQALKISDDDRRTCAAEMAEITKKGKQLEALQSSCGNGDSVLEAEIADAKTQALNMYLQIKKHHGECEQVKIYLDFIHADKEQSLLKKEQLGAILIDAEKIADCTAALLNDLDFMLRPEGQDLGETAATLSLAMQARFDEISQLVAELDQVLVQTQQQLQALIPAVQESHSPAGSRADADFIGEESTQVSESIVEEDAGAAIGQGQLSVNQPGDFDASAHLEETEDSDPSESADASSHTPHPGDAFIGMVTVEHAPGFFAHQHLYAGWQDYLDPCALKIPAALLLTTGLLSFPDVTETLAGLVSQAASSDFSALL